MKINVFINPGRNDSETKSLVEKLLMDKGFEIDEKNPDVVLYLGGDGTFLRAVEAYFNKLEYVYFIGINYGNLGFFYDFQKSDLDALIAALENNDFKVTEHALLQGDIVFENKTETVYAVNEIRVENPFHTLICDVLINDKNLETFHGNGLLVASSYGSTAYNKSLGGAVVSHNLECLQLTEIATIQNNFNRSLGSSLILSKQDRITLRGEFRRSVVGFDYKTTSDDGLKELTISLSDKKVRMLHPKDYSEIIKLKRSFIKWFTMDSCK